MFSVQQPVNIRNIFAVKRRKREYRFCVGKKVREDENGKAQKRDLNIAEFFFPRKPLVMSKYRYGRGAYKNK